MACTQTDGLPALPRPSVCFAPDAVEGGDVILDCGLDRKGEK